MKSQYQVVKRINIGDIDLVELLKDKDNKYAVRKTFLSTTDNRDKREIEMAIICSDLNIGPRFIEAYETGYITSYVEGLHPGKIKDIFDCLPQIIHYLKKYHSISKAKHIRESSSIISESRNRTIKEALLLIGEYNIDINIPRINEWFSKRYKGKSSLVTSHGDLHVNNILLNKETLDPLFIDHSRSRIAEVEFDLGYLTYRTYNQQFIKYKDPDININLFLKRLVDTYFITEKEMHLEKVYTYLVFHLIHDTVWWLTNRKDMNQTKISDQKDVLEFNQTFLANINNQ